MDRHACPVLICRESHIHIKPREPVPLSYTYNIPCLHGARAKKMCMPHCGSRPKRTRERVLKEGTHGSSHVQISIWCIRDLVGGRHDPLLADLDPFTLARLAFTATLKKFADRTFHVSLYQTPPWNQAINPHSPQGRVEGRTQPNIRRSYL